MRQTIAQYIGSIRRIAPGVQYQVNAWPFPQARQSHIAIWIDRDSDPKCCLPENHIKIYLDHSREPGVLMRVREDMPSPSAIADQLGKEEDQMKIHTKDSDCTLGPDECCAVCGVWHADPCPGCGQRGYHLLRCPELTNPTQTETSGCEPCEGNNLESEE